MKTGMAAFAAAIFAAWSAGCSVENVEKTEVAPSEAGSGQEMKRIQVNGSSTVEKVSSAIAESFESQFPGVQVAVKGPGTGTGFKELSAGRADIANASRVIKESERAECEKNGIQALELKIALDGLSVCVHPENDWCDAITVADLRKIWSPGSTVSKWSDVNPAWPEQEMRLYGAGEESGTFDYFTEAINGKEDAITENYSPSADDNVILTGIAGDRYAMGFLGCAYYFLNRDKVRALKVSPTENVADAVELTPEAVESGRYTPLSRPLFIYVRTSSLKRQEVEDFVRYTLNEGQSQVEAVHYVPLSEADLTAAREAFEAAVKQGL